MKFTDPGWLFGFGKLHEIHVFCGLQISTMGEGAILEARDQLPIGRGVVMSAALARGKATA